MMIEYQTTQFMTTRTRKNIIDDDDDSLGEYEGDLELNKFNEDGSFIGLYANKKDKKTPKSESDV